MGRIVVHAAAVALCAATVQPLQSAEQLLETIRNSPLPIQAGSDHVPFAGKVRVKNQDIQILNHNIL